MNGDSVALYRAGRISAEVAVARLILDAPPELVAARLAASGQAPELLGLIDLHRRQLVRMHALTRRAHAPKRLDQAAAMDACRKLFDHAADEAPEIGVATYSLGDLAILERATMELVAWLDAENLTASDSDVLDLGCGTGRVAAAIAPRVRSVLGLDLSPGMVRTARLRHTASKLRFETTAGHDLTELAGERFDLILAVDSFPYLIQQGVADTCFAAAAAALRPGGALVILNLSYRADPAADRTDAVRWSSQHGLDLRLAGVQPFRLWDGAAFVFDARPSSPWSSSILRGKGHGREAHGC